MLDELVFGWRTAILVPPMAVMVCVAAALTKPLSNRAANRLLAVLLVILVGTITPWAIGFAGFYDRWQWLSFVPFSNPLAVAPLFYSYLFALVHGRVLDKWALHMIAPALAGGLLFVSLKRMIC